MDPADAQIKTSTSHATRLKLAIRGAVQGVGFRPFIFRLATELRLAGWVNNSPQGVFIEAEGSRADLEAFLLRVEKERPARSFIQSLEATWLDPINYSRFEIRDSETAGAKTAFVLPDIATCPDCLQEIFDPKNRRYEYPFTNCTNCGPRFSIIEALPYDRANTSMKKFRMCDQCQAEYDDPTNRRFHAQPNACSVCGPQLELWDPAGQAVTKPGKEALLGAAAAIRSGKILALKGLGGYQLMVAAHDETAVQRLRDLKHREEKPFALMFPSLESAKTVCVISPLEERLICAPEAPIVLLHRKQGIANAPTAPGITSLVAPGNPNLGVMLPYTPLHHVLLSLLGFPVVATSGNLSDEPICITESEALERLGPLADLFLVHNRPIIRHVDDSIVRIMAGRELVLRRARGYAPLPVILDRIATPGSPPVQLPTIIAVGAHLKNTVALAIGTNAFLSQHIGDLETDQAYTAFRRVITDLEQLYEADPEVIAADAHPDYLSTKFARELASQNTRLRYCSVQHHLAHVLACMTENELRHSVLGVSWDGTGYGPDQTIWGGEFFIVDEDSWSRVAHFRPFRLPGGERAIKEPRRTAIGLLFEMLGVAAFERSDLAPVTSFSTSERNSLERMLVQRFNSPITSSVGRLFDAISSLIGQRQFVRFEGQAAMELEFALEGLEIDEFYQLPLSSSNSAILTQASGLILDWAPLIKSVLADLKNHVSIGNISAKFHNGLIEAIIEVARLFDQEYVALSGGCFQNRYLTERAVRRLREEGFRSYWHQRVPPNDGGIALGQLAAAARENWKGAKG
ncbi:MAG TPA: carbamoyltransferase HypF [Candidatus Limnocylindrales bacterium]|jgi:hydrogenase maturation protein HypF|nr:carbamoyltransferase HypF [Candidatus Limnocylindrales bacterium]